MRYAFIFMMVMTVCVAPFRAMAAELILFESDGCPYCERWHEEIGVIYNKSDEGKVLPLRTVDHDFDLPADLSAIRGVYFTPTFVIWEDGKELGRILGYPGEDFFWPMLSELIEQNSLAPFGGKVAKTPPVGSCVTAVC